MASFHWGKYFGPIATPLHSALIVCSCYFSPSRPGRPHRQGPSHRSESWPSNQELFQVSLSSFAALCSIAFLSTVLPDVGWTVLSPIRCHDFTSDRSHWDPSDQYSTNCQVPMQHATTHEHMSPGNERRRLRHSSRQAPNRDSSLMASASPPRSRRRLRPRARRPRLRMSSVDSKVLCTWLCRRQ